MSKIISDQPDTHLAVRETITIDEGPKFPIKLGEVAVLLSVTGLTEKNVVSKMHFSA